MGSDASLKIVVDSFRCLRLKGGDERQFFSMDRRGQSPIAFPLTTADRVFAMLYGVTWLVRRPHF